MRPIINMLDEDWATDIGNMHKKFGKDRTSGSGNILADRQTDTQTETLMKILRNRSHGRSNEQYIDLHEWYQIDKWTQWMHNETLNMKYLRATRLTVYVSK